METMETVATSLRRLIRTVKMTDLKHGGLNLVKVKELFKDRLIMLPKMAILQFNAEGKICFVCDQVDMAKLKQQLRLRILEM